MNRLVQAYKRNPEKAWSELIDNYLNSERYGERLGQHWLDVARYADTGGYSNDYERSNAWRYRDYVTRALNIDKPYDQFLTEQLAGKTNSRTKPSAPKAYPRTSSTIPEQRATTLKKKPNGSSPRVSYA